MKGKSCVGAGIGFHEAIEGHLGSGKTALAGGNVGAGEGMIMSRPLTF